ncbi:hypothetical protein C5S36_03650 [Candidatus Methanophagaceae archaeon]|nr:hypothetical protein C5S36_03650 [Methanophagales archaeon]
MKKMKKQIVMVTVAIMLMAVLIAPPVMAYAVKDGDSVQYSSHRGYNYITDNSVTASNQPYITLRNGIGGRENSSRVRYYNRAPVPVRTSNQPIVIDRGIGAVSGISVYSADGKMLYSENFANEIKETDSNIVIIDESDDLNLTIVGEAPPPVKLETSGLIKNATRLIDESDDFAVEYEAPGCLLRDDVLGDVALMNEKLATNNRERARSELDGIEWRVPEWRELGTITEGVATGKIIKGTRENHEQIIIYFETDDGKVHPVILTNNRTIDLTR